MNSRFLKFAIFCHRWLGVSCCLLFVLWFASGIVMMYWSFPEIGTEERLRKAESLTPAGIRISPEAAYRSLERADSPDQARLRMLDGRPVYRFKFGPADVLIYADSGERLSSGQPDTIQPDTARRIAARWVGLPAQVVKFEGSLHEPDQWTVSGEYRALRPLLKFSSPDGDQVYVSARTGEVAQATTRRSRAAAYFGAIPHWLYWTPLRKKGSVWSRVVEWAAAVATLTSLMGLFAGFRMYSPKQRYSYHGAPTRIPYRRQKRWHMILGLTFGTLAASWTFSGLLSMEPFEWLSGDNAGAAATDRALRGRDLRMTAFSSKPPGEALRQAGAGVKELDLVLFAGSPHYLARRTAMESLIVPVEGNASELFEASAIARLVAEAWRPVALAETRVLSEYDAYYLDRHRRHPLPALLLRLNDARRSTFYVDLKTAEIVEAYDNRSRWNRWLYHGLHSWNFPWLYRYRPAWDILVLTLLFGGASLSVTAALLGVALLRAKLRFRTPSIDDTRIATL